ncbi:MAG: hypothetical protein WAZ18_04420 [Alphaproteobacteria bacterium]
MVDVIKPQRALEISQGSQSNDPEIVLCKEELKVYHAIIDYMNRNIAKAARTGTSLSRTPSSIRSRITKGISHKDIYIGFDENGTGYGKLSFADPLKMALQTLRSAGYGISMIQRTNPRYAGLEMEPKLVISWGDADIKDMS